MHKANFVGNEEIQQGSVSFADRSPDAPVILDKYHRQNGKENAQRALLCAVNCTLIDHSVADLRLSDPMHWRNRFTSFSTVLSFVVYMGVLHYPPLIAPCYAQLKLYHRHHLAPSAAWINVPKETKKHALRYRTVGTNC